jgi:hypothetical protein
MHIFDMFFVYNINQGMLSSNNPYNNNIQKHMIDNKLKNHNIINI